MITTKKTEVAVEEGLDAKLESIHDEYLDNAPGIN